MSGTDLVVVQLDRARVALIEATTLSQVKSILAIADAARVYAQRQKLGEEAVRYATEVKLDAERRLGEMLAQAPKNEGGRPLKTSSDGELVSTPTLADLGIDRKTSMRSQQLAALDQETFDAVKSGETSLRELQGTQRRDERMEKIAEIARGSAALPTTLYPVIYADPPWQYEHVKTESRAIENQYPTMTLDDICALPVPASDDAILFLWATSPKLAEAMRVVESWGFTYRTCAVWDKEVIGMGYYFRQQHELLLVATRGDLPAPAPEARKSSVLRAKRGQHSEKPEAMAEAIEAMYPTLPRIELFCRAPRPGWAVWGYEAEAA